MNKIEAHNFYYEIIKVRIQKLIRTSSKFILFRKIKNMEINLSSYKMLLNRKIRCSDLYIYTLEQNLYIHTLVIHDMYTSTIQI
jgi:hypothetical protein